MINSQKMTQKYTTDTSKAKSDTEDENEQIEYLQEKIQAMEQNYVRIEQFYMEKIKKFYDEINKKEAQYWELHKQIAELRHLSFQHKEKASQLLIKFQKEQQISEKKKSPTVKSHGQASKDIPKEFKQRPFKNKGKSFSPRINTKKKSPVQAKIGGKKSSMFPRNLYNEEKCLIKNLSQELSSKIQSGKRLSPNIEKDSKTQFKLIEKQGTQDPIKQIKIVQKSKLPFRQKVPVFK